MCTIFSGILLICCSCYVPFLSIVAFGSLNCKKDEGRENMARILTGSNSKLPTRRGEHPPIFLMITIKGKIYKHTIKDKGSANPEKSHSHTRLLSENMRMYFMNVVWENLFTLKNVSLEMTIGGILYS